MNIRKADNTKNDCDLVFSLSNDALVRENSFSTKTIEYDSHCNWYKRTISDNNTLFFLVFNNKSLSDTNSIAKVFFKFQAIFIKNIVFGLLF